MAEEAAETTPAEDIQDKPTALSTSRHISILGTGSYATAFSGRLLTAGYSVTLGSRHPERHRHRHRHRASFPASAADGDVIVTSLEDCVKGSDVIIVALHVGHFEEVFTPELSRLCCGKVLVDVSNRTTRSRSSAHSTGDRTKSNAHLLAGLTPGAQVVKAFNSLSAYVMENDVTTALSDRRAVAVASDDVTARARVCRLAEELGFDPRENGDLRNAWGMEEMMMTVFPEWGVSAVVTLLLLLFWFLFAVSRFYLADNKLHWDQLPLKVFNKVLGATALSLLSLTYFPATCSACVLMVRGTKHEGLPSWLETWLKARKQLGLTAFGLVFLHFIISVLILSPTYVSAWWMKKAPDVFRLNISAASLNNHSDNVVELVAVPASSGQAWMTWVGELSLLMGVTAFALMSLLAVTSFPSVTRALNWSEWRLLHSRLGYVMMTLAVTHVYVMGVPRWSKTGFPLVLFRVKFLSIVMPTFVIAARLLLLLPCMDAYVRRIRLGWERKPAHTNEREV